MMYSILFCIIMSNVLLINGADEPPTHPPGGESSTHPPGGEGSTHPPGGEGSTHPPGGQDKPDPDDLLSQAQKTSVCAAADALKDEALCAAVGPADANCNAISQSISATEPKCVAEHVCAFKVPPDTNDDDGLTTAGVDPNDGGKKSRRDVPETTKPPKAPKIPIEDYFVYVSNLPYREYETVHYCEKSFAIVVPGGAQRPHT